MSRKTYLLITRSSLLLIVLLVSAPVVDFYRFGRFVPAGGATLPIGAILPTARGASTAAPDTPDATEPPAVPRPAAAVPASSGATAPAAAPARAASFRPPDPRSTAPVAARRSEFEAWTAAGQIDPFWDGNERPSSRAAATGAEPGPAEQELASAGESSATAVPPVEVTEAARGTSKKSAAPRDRNFLSAGEPRVEPPESADTAKSHAEGDTAANDDGDAAPPVDGWIIGNPPAPTNGPEGGRIAPDPSPPPPPTGGGVGPSRALPHEPSPRPITYPTAHIDAPTAPVGVGDSFDVMVRVDSVERMTSLPFHVIFDAGLLSFVSAQTGPALGGLQPVLLASVNPNRPGDLAVGLSLIESSGTFSGSGNLIVLRFQAIASGRSDLAFGHATLRGPASEPVETQFNGGSIQVR
jgi:hypothetical protein